jgi:ubiquinone/menaquinone biosynthesis C-methylase UbiE
MTDTPNSTTPGTRERRPQRSDVLDLLGSGDGVCLDVGCGSGLYFDVLTVTGRTVVGLDQSADQLRIAQSRPRRILQGDAAALPFADCPPRQKPLTVRSSRVPGRVAAR